MNKLKLNLEVPPSVNKYLYPKICYNGSKVFARLAETSEAQKYKVRTGKIIRTEIQKQNWIIPKERTFVNVKIDYYFQKKGMDPNNFLKILYDTFKECKIYIDDDIAKPQTGLVVIDKFNPRLEIEIYESKQIGVFKNQELRNRFIEEYKDSFHKRSFNAMLRKLDEGRILENTYLNENKEVKIREK